MFQRTKDGWALGPWEGRPVQLADCRITRCEIQAAVCGANGLTYRQSAEEMHCSRSNVDQAWQNLYYKLRCNRRERAISLLVDIGALRRLMAILLILNAIVPHDMMRTVRTRPVRGGVTRAAAKRGAARGSAVGLLAGMLQQLDQLTGAGDCYTAADVMPWHA